MPSLLHVHLLPDGFDAKELAGSTAVVIDVLRATTTIPFAMQAGAKKVIPCLEVDEARALAAGLGREDVLLGGERGGKRIEGFDLGNSPSEYRSEVVAGKTLVFTTTNGTWAMQRCRLARQTWLASFANLSVVVGRIVQAEGAVHLVCAGTERRVTREDVLCAGAIVERVMASGKLVELNDSAMLAASAWHQIRGADATVLAREFESTQGGRNLRKIGQEADLLVAARIDAVSIVPELDLTDWVIRANST